MSRSKLCRLGIGADGASAATAGLLFSQFDPGHKWEPIDIGSNLGGYGLLGHPVQITRDNVKVVQPRGQFKPSLEEWALFLPWVLNTTGVDDDGEVTFTPGTAATYRVLDYHDTSIYHRLLKCAVGKATIAAQARQEVTLDLEMMGTDFSNSGSMPSLSPPLGTRFLFADGAIAATGFSSIPARSFRIEIDHQLAQDRYYYGSIQAAPLNLDRATRLSLEIPFGLVPTFWNALADDGGLPISITLTAIIGIVTSTLVFSFVAVRAPNSPPPAQVPNELFMTVDAVCYANGVTTPEIVAVLTPEV
jgi:hypothetical protein